MVMIDLNCDCGESFGVWSLGDDRALLAHVSSANVACGGHAGDPDTMRRTLRLAGELGVSIGAHPGFPDTLGFGRRVIPMTSEQVFNSLLFQVGALDAIARAEGVALMHVKPHGALYNQAATTLSIAATIAAALAVWNQNVVLVGLAGSEMIKAGRDAGLPVAREAFADRRYEADGTLRSRHLPGAVIDDPHAAAAQAVNIATRGYVVTLDGAHVPVEADTICVHGDLPGAAERASAVRRSLDAAGVIIAPLPVVLRERKA